MSEEFDRIAAAVRPTLDSRHSAREHAITTSRRIIRSSANAIRCLHRGDTDGAATLLAEARALYESIVASVAAPPELMHVGYASDAAKELSEASLTAALFAGETLPGHEELGVDPVPYLHGLGEAVGAIAGDAEVGDLDPRSVPAGEQQVGRLDVAVHDAVGVRRA